VRKESNGKEYVVPKDLKLNFDPKGMTIHLDNLFNGDKFLGKWGHVQLVTDAQYTPLCGTGIKRRVRALVLSFGRVDTEYTVLWVLMPYFERISASIFMMEEQRMKVTNSSAVESVRSVETSVEFLQD
jgi:hypothetical protein